MIAAGQRVIFSPPAVGRHAPVGVYGVVLGVAPWATAPCWPGAVIYRVRVGFDEHFVIDAMLTMIDGPPARYACEAGRA